MTSLLNRNGVILLVLAPALHAQNAPEFSTEANLGSLIPGAIQVLASDVDGDGLVDLLGYSGFLGELIWMRNRGTGVLDSGNYEAGRTLASFPLSADDHDLGFSAGDASGDGLDDYFMNSSDGRHLFYVENVGGGVAQAPVSILELGAGSTSYVGPSPTLIDFDSDGDLDVVVVRRFLSFAIDRPILLENTGGTFARVPGAFPAGLPIVGLEPGDLDGDGDMDLAAWTNHEISWLRNVGGTFVEVPLMDVGVDGPEREEAMDIDGDGDVDLVFASDLQVTFYENTDGLGTFGPPITHAVFIDFLALLDMDGDGDLDLVKTGWRRNQLKWVEVLPGFGLGSRHLVTPDNVPNIRAITVADLDQDGRADVLVPQGEGPLTAFKGQATSGQPAVNPTPLGLTRHFSTPVDAAYSDFDGDGLVDMVVASNAGQLVLVRQDAAGGFGVPEPILTSPQIAHGVMAYDLDGDGLNDLVTLAWERLPLEFDRRLVVLFGLAGGSFGPPVQLSTQATFRGDPVALDLDQDGDLDIVVGDENGPSLVAFDQIAPGQFAATPRVLFGLQGNVSNLEVADFDLDGLEDLALVTGGSSSLSRRHLVCRSLGNGNLIPQQLQVFISENGGRKMIPADLDGDGDPDLVWVDEAGDRLTARENLGGFAFSTSFQVLSLGDQTRSFEMAHLNTDGVADVVVNGAAGQPMRRALSMGPLSYGPLESIQGTPTGMTPGPLVDLGQDGDLDVIGFSSLYRDVFVYESEFFDVVGIAECGPAVPNSTGVPGTIAAIGSTSVTDRALRLQASSLPPSSLTLFITSRSSGFVVGAGGSLGNLCLSGTVGRFLANGAAQLSTASGGAELNIDLSEIPQPTGSVGVLTGDTWRFQAWHRDLVGGQLASNFTNAARVVFL